MSNEETVVTGTRGPDDTEALRRMRPSKALFILVGLAAFFVPIILVLGKEVVTVVLERTPPMVELTDEPRGVGIAPSRLSGIVKDEASGLSHVVVEVFQENQRISLLDQELPQKTKSFDLSLLLDGKQLPLREGNASLRIKATDRARFPNTTEKILPLLVDRRRPEGSLLLPSLNRRVGEPELCFFRVTDLNLLDVTLRHGKDTWPVYKAKQFDPEIVDEKIYGSFIPNDSDEPVKIVVQDGAGNTSSIMCGAALNAPVVRLETRALTLPEVSGSRTDEVKEVVARLKTQNEATLQSLFNAPSVGERLWSDFFESPFSSSVELPFESVIDSGFPFPLQGLLFKSTRGSLSVTAPSSGMVVGVVDLPLYGRTVVLDHGLGLWSLFGGLETIDVASGMKLRKGTLIGKAGAFSMLDSSPLFYQMRIHGYPINPQHFFDSSWYLLNVPKRIGALKRVLELPITNPIER